MTIRTAAILALMTLVGGLGPLEHLVRTTSLR